MAWTAGVTRTTGDLISAADWNDYLGASGSLDFVHEKLYTAPVTERTTGTSGTTYVNGTYLRLVNISSLFSLDEGCEVYIGTQDPPSDNRVVYERHWQSTAAEIHCCSFLVPPNYKYRYYDAVGTPQIMEWHEWDIHS